MVETCLIHELNLAATFWTFRLAGSRHSRARRITHFPERLSMYSWNGKHEGNSGTTTDKNNIKGTLPPALVALLSVGTRLVEGVETLHEGAAQASSS